MYLAALFGSRQPKYDCINSEKPRRRSASLSFSDDEESSLTFRSSLRSTSPSRPLRFRFLLGICTKSFLAFVSLILIVYLLSRIPSHERSIERDLKRYFRPLGIKPAAWDVPVEGKDVGCVRRYSGGGEVDRKSSFLADLGERIAETHCRVFPIPDSGLITHLFWAGNWRDASHGLTLDAWLATQPFETSSLIWWYEGVGPSDAFREKYTGADSPYRNVVSFRKFDESLAEGTCLMGMREWIDEKYRQEINMPIPSRSDLIRLLLLSKFGGIWLDADSIPLRDLTPLVRAGPAVPSFENTINNNFLVYGPAWSGVGERVLSLACQMPYNETKINELYPKLKTKDWFSFSWLWNTGVHQLCRTRGCGVGDLAMQLVDGMHWSKNFFRPCEQGKYPTGSAFPPSLHGPFTWHARMTQLTDRHTCWDRKSGTLLSAVKERVEGVLYYNRLSLGQGKDLFPGPGYVG